MDVMENQDGVSIDTEEACSNFTLQNWRKSKCQHCFKDVLEHEKISNDINIEQVRYLSDQQNDDCFEKCGTVYAICIDEDQIRNNKINEGRILLTSTSTVVDVEQQQQLPYSRKPEFSKRSRHYQLRNSKGIRKLFCNKFCFFIILPFVVLFCYCLCVVNVIIRCLDASETCSMEL